MPSVRLRIRETIWIEDAPLSAQRAIASELTLPNPLYFRLLRMGKHKALWGVKKDFRYWQRDGSTLKVGRGNLARLESYFTLHQIPYAIQDETIAPPITKPLKGDIQYRDYQQGDIEQILQYKNGVIRMQVGYGKTLIACALAQRLNVKALILVPRVNLIDQFAGEFKRLFNYRVGIVQGTTEDVRDITIASIATLQKRPDLQKRLAQTTGCLIYDEVHTVVTSKRLALVQAFKPKYVWGLTGTADRTDEQGEAIFFTFGPMVIDKDFLKVQPEVVCIESPHPIHVQEYADMVTEQIEHPQRNALIVDTIRGEIKRGRKVLVLTKRIAHYEKLHAALKDYRVFSIASKDTVGERADILKGLRDGTKEFDAVFGTVGMLATGINVPLLDSLVIAGDLRSRVLVIQGVGRILRLFANKQRPRVVDIQDRFNGVFWNQAKSRMKVYKQWGWFTE